MPTQHLLIKGQVQGVFYRATARETAAELGITGWVKNTPDGDVEIVASGSEEQLQTFINWCKRGPRSAIVSEVIATPQEEAFFEAFSIIR
jgi:acylphosphatase